MRTGQIVDFYDDPTGMILKAKVAQADLPDFIKVAQFLDEPTRNKLPDDVFALVMVDTDQTFRKYACQDKGNTALSVIYFMETHDRLPEEAQKVAAANLLTACGWYGIDPPAQLRKIAVSAEWIKKRVAHAAEGASTKRLEQFKEKMLGNRFKWGGEHKAKALTAAKAARDAGELRGLSGAANEAYYESGHVPEHLHRRIVKLKEKKSELSGSEIMPRSGPEKQSQMEGEEKVAAKKPPLSEWDKLWKSMGRKRPSWRSHDSDGLSKADKELAKKVIPGVAAGGLALGAGGYAVGRALDPDKKKEKRGDMSGTDDLPRQSPGKEEPEKLGALQPYVNVTGKEAPVKVASVRYERYGLVKEGAANRFPLDSYGQVKEASSWFDDYHQSLHPADRHEFATKLASRAGELDIKVSDLIKKYGSTDYAPSGEVNVAIHCRMQHWAEDAPERDMLQGLMGKYASVQPDVFCESLRQFDEMTGLTREWDETIYDPWYSTYGFNKQAEEWVFSHAGERITSEQLRRFGASVNYCKIKHTFGDELADALKKDPEKIFDSLPLDSKRIIMRLAADPQP